MIIVDRALQAREAAHNPLQVGMIGAGFMAQGIAHQLLKVVPGMRLAAVANRNPEKAAQLYRQYGVEDALEVHSSSALEDAIGQGRYAYSADARLLCQASGLDVLIEVTGAVQFAAETVLEAFANGKHVLSMSAELDGTLGPILRHYAHKAGLMFSFCDGDQPGVEMNLYRFVKGMGLTPLVCGNIKGLHDPYRTPTTQRAFAERWKQKAHMVTSFADGTKISFEQAIVANGTGMTIAKRGMQGFEVAGKHVDACTELFDLESLKQQGGIVDYLVAAQPGPGVFVYASQEDPEQQHYLELYKLGKGPLYSFYTPYHLCHLEVPFSVARLLLFHDAVLEALEPKVDVVATAKTDLKAGDILDGLGYYMTYGQCERADVCFAEGLLPIGVAEGCRLLRDVPKDSVLRYADVQLPPGRLCDRLRDEQNALFFGQTISASS